MNKESIQSGKKSKELNNDQTTAIDTILYVSLYMHKIVHASNKVQYS